MIKSNILVSVISYDYINNAEFLKYFFSQKFDTILIHSESNEYQNPNNLDFLIPNQYYTGLWNKSVESAITNNYEWLIIIASDITIIQPDINSINNYIQDITKTSNIGVYTFSTDPESRTAFEDLYNRSTNNIRPTKSVEGFCFMCKTDVLQYMYPVNSYNNKYGWGLDRLMCKIANSINLDVVVDDRVTIHHPASSIQIDKSLAIKQYGKV